MNTFLTVSGIVAWIVFGISLVWYLLGFVKPPRALRKLLSHPSIFHYVRYLSDKLGGLMLSWRHRLGLISTGAVDPEFIRKLRAIKLDHTRQLRDAFLRVDELPTVKAGKKALGIDSIFEIHPRRRFAPSEYTHPLQNPPFFIPGVPAKTFYPTSELEWVAPLEEAFATIKRELLDLLDHDGAGFSTYANEYMALNAGWNTYNFFFFGEKFEENCARCPETTALLESLPRFERDHIMFSALNPHTRIPPHYGPMNGILRAHLPLIVPQGCYIKVGEDERPWEEGKVMVFDDSFLHQVWNHSDSLRIVLFLNFWHPCFAAEEIPVLEEFRSAYELSPLAKQHAHNQAKKRAHDIKKKAVRDSPEPAASGAAAS